MLCPIIIFVMRVRRTHLRFRITFAAEDAYRGGRRPRHVRRRIPLTLSLSPVPSLGPSLSTRTHRRAHTVFIVYNDFRTFRQTPDVCLRTVCPTGPTHTRPIVPVFERPPWLKLCVQRNSRYSRNTPDWPDSNDGRRSSSFRVPSKRCPESKLSESSERIANKSWATLLTSPSGETIGWNYGRGATDGSRNSSAALLCRL